MAEQSSTVVAFRALTMLICLILVPVAAFCGGSFPAVIKAIQNGRVPTLADFRGSTSSPSGQIAEAPRFVPPSVSTRPADARQSGTARSEVPSMPQVNSSQSSVIAVNYASPITTSRPNDVERSTSFPQDKSLGTGPSRGLSPVPPGTGDLLPVDRESAAKQLDASAAAQDRAGGSARDNQLRYILDRLRQLGATYFVLEPCGDKNGQYRFYCRMSMGGNSQVTKPFWCFDSDALKAMTQVLKQVEDWQSGGG
jgi:hypothetical protein